ncbi:pre-mrna-splicing factor cwc2 [Gossypium arboreum]|uniref:Pre-mrna-splicing factor cwc2 n=1 Tax=Gossypium arboreum TaxID=29729 RepID=A0A0B0MA17_GOSAR|nr:pre-mrna-splicing factor cwc2 [Gossypium arboreum]
MCSLCLLCSWPLSLTTCICSLWCIHHCCHLSKPTCHLAHNCSVGLSKFFLHHLPQTTHKSHPLSRPRQPSIVPYIDSSSSPNSPPTTLLQQLPSTPDTSPGKRWARA